MTLRHEPDVSHADWFARSDDDWWQLCSIGPSGFAAYARVFHRTHDDSTGETYSLQEVEGLLDAETSDALREVLARHTSTADDCFHALWEGHGGIDGRHIVQLHRGHGSRIRKAPTGFGKDVMRGPQVVIPARKYFLFRGPLRDAGSWPTRDGEPISTPNLLWPADRTWFLATEIDQPWTGIGGSAALVSELLADDRLDAVPATASPALPYGRD
jgi:hypothetical protein